MKFKLLTSLNCTYKTVKMVRFMLCAFYRNFKKLKKMYSPSGNLHRSLSQLSRHHKVLRWRGTSLILHLVGLR